MKPTAYSFCKILNTHFSRSYCKDSSYTVNIIEKLGVARRTDRNTTNFAAKQIRGARENYWMHELQFFRTALMIIHTSMLLVNFYLCHENMC